jgi:hypothetical protein
MGEEFQRIAVGPVGVGELDKVAAPGGAGIVDQDVDPPAAPLYRARERRRRILLAQVDRQRLDLPAVRADRCGGLA